MLLGILLATWILSGLTTWVGTRLPIPLLSQVSIDPSVMGFAAIVTVLTTLICGLAPALGATGGSLVTALRDGAPSVSGGRRGRVIRQSFVMAEIALALTVLCGAGLLGRSVMELQGVRPGFTAESALSLRVALPARTYGNGSADSPNANAQHIFYTRAIEGLKALPGVTAVGGTSFLPLAGAGPATSFWRADAPQPAPEERPVVDARPVTQGYFTAMQIPMLAGRDVNDADTPDKTGGDRQRDVRAADLSGRQPDRTQVHPESRQRKAARDHRRGRRREARDAEGEVRPTVYLSSRQYAFGLMNFVVRTTGDPAPPRAGSGPRDQGHRSAAAGVCREAAR